jgi:hypothetical protein
LINYEDICTEIVSNPRYQANILYGKARRGHQEGTVQAHIMELEANLQTLNVQGLVSADHYWKLMVLIHVHDSFKAEAKRDSAILDPQSHASLAREFLSNYCDDEDMLNIVQYHDLGFAVYRKFQQTGRLDEAKLMTGLTSIKDLNLFLLFAIIDACTASKGREMITWFVKIVNHYFPSRVSVNAAHILPGANRLAEVW